jgi:hypothetical protein
MLLQFWCILPKFFRVRGVEIFGSILFLYFVDKLAQLVVSISWDASIQGFLRFCLSVPCPSTRTLPPVGVPIHCPTGIPSLAATLACVIIFIFAVAWPDGNADLHTSVRCKLWTLNQPLHKFLA